MTRANFPFKQLRLRIVVGVGIMVLIAAVHLFRLGSYLDGNYYILYYSYASDLMLPFGCYFLLAINEIQVPILRGWLTKAILVFVAMTCSEIMQFFGVYFFGTTFDPVDLFIYAAGTLLAVFLDKMIFEKMLPLWLYNKE